MWWYAEEIAHTGFAVERQCTPLSPAPHGILCTLILEKQEPNALHDGISKNYLFCYYNLFLGNFFHDNGFNDHVLFGHLHVSIFSTHVALVLQNHIPKCLLIVTTWMFPLYLIENMFKTDLNSQMWFFSWIPWYGNVLAHSGSY